MANERVTHVSAVVDAPADSAMRVTSVYAVVDAPADSQMRVTAIYVVVDAVELEVSTGGFPFFMPF